MTSYVALLRAVNVGGRNRLSMATLRDALTAEGVEQVSTVLQSGNILFRAKAAEGAVTALIGGILEESFGLRIHVIVRSATELAAVAATNPFVRPGHESDPARLHVAFLTDPPAAASVASLDPSRSPPDAFVVSGREVYLSYPNGSGRSRLSLDYLERTLATAGTARNWRTTQRLAALLEGSDYSPIGVT